ncbi:hypothetical protein EG68_06205 [Paragonimus skrjabini miyazakii]|uniref:Uncharacterized protein n=1 Tax=Paragonimus skrjabini miyazakii TaxID=59628 RepID=A0A8S9YVS5_9TREM|nr:hypothetical protein EG68_06205 [Paragonimus skrjabini miyazakii]
MTIPILNSHELYVISLRSLQLQIDGNIGTCDSLKLSSQNVLIALKACCRDVDAVLGFVCDCCWNPYFGRTLFRGVYVAPKVETAGLHVTYR